MFCPDLIPYPEDTGISLRSDDGAYFKLAADNSKLAQIIVVGPMMYAPAVYAEALSRKTGARYRLLFLQFMESTTKRHHLAVMERGFVSIMLRRLRNAS